MKADYKKWSWKLHPKNAARAHLYNAWYEANRTKDRTLNKERKIDERLKEEERYVEEHAREQRLKKQMLAKVDFDTKRALSDNQPGPSEAPASKRSKNVVESPEAEKEMDLQHEEQELGTTDIAEGDADMMMAGAGRGGSGGAGGMRGTAELPRKHHAGPTSYTRTYKKQYQIRIRTDVLQYVKTDQAAYTTFPIYEIPWEYVGFYMTADEIHEACSKYTRFEIEQVNIDISNSTAILNFETGASVASVGNNNVGFRIAEMDNLRGTRAGFYQTPMPTVIKQVFWGNHGASLPNAATPTATSIATLGAAFVPRNFPYKFNYEFAGQGSPAGILNYYNPTVFNWNAYKKNRRNASMEEGHFFSQSWKPKSKYLTGRNCLNAGFANQAQYVSQPGVRLNPLQNMMSVSSITPANIGTVPDAFKNRAPFQGKNIWPIVTVGQTPTVNPLVNNRVPGSLDGHLVPGPALPLYRTSGDYAFLTIDNNNYFDPELGNAQEGFMPTCAISMDLLINSTADNATIEGSVELTINCELIARITEGNVNKLFPHAGSGGYPCQFPNPMYQKPIEEFRSLLFNTAGLSNGTYTNYTTSVDQESFERYKQTYQPTTQAIVPLTTANGRIPFVTPALNELMSVEEEKKDAVLEDESDAESEEDYAMQLKRKKLEN